MGIIKTMTHNVTDNTRQAVKYMKIAGATNEQVADYLGISDETLRKYYKSDLDHGRRHCQQIIVGALFKKVMAGDTASIIFACKTICGLKESAPVDVVIPQMIINPPAGERPNPVPPIHGK